MINQRYIFMLRCNNQQLYIFSNHDRFKAEMPFAVKPNTWYTIKSRVDVTDDGSGVVRVKVWERGQDEPQAWTLEAKHAAAHTHGAPGFYGLTPQAIFPVYIDNLKVTPND